MVAAWRRWFAQVQRCWSHRWGITAFKSALPFFMVLLCLLPCILLQFQLQDHSENRLHSHIEGFNIYMWHNHSYDKMLLWADSAMRLLSAEGKFSLLFFYPCLFIHSFLISVQLLFPSPAFSSICIFKIFSLSPRIIHLQLWEVVNM